MVDGNFLRGVVNQRNTNRQLEVSEGQLGLQQQVFRGRQTAQERERLAQVSESIRQQSTELGATIQQLKENNVPDADIFKTVQPAFDMLKQQIQATEGIDPLVAEKLKLDFQTALSTLNPNEAAVASGVTDAVKTRAELSATLGREPTDEELARAVDVDPTQPSEPIIVRLQRAKTNALGQGKVEAAAEIQAQIDSLGASESFDPRNKLDTSKKEDEQLRGAIKSGAAAGKTIQNVLDEFIATPEAGGITGTITEGVGGVAQQLGLGGVAEALAGASIGEITAVRTQARLAVSQLLSTVTGETSGRFTDTERKIAQEILRSLDINASPDQIKSALSTFQKINDTTMLREVSSLASRSELNLRKSTDLQKLMKTLRDQGLSEQDSLDLITKLLTSEGIDSVE